MTTRAVEETIQAIPKLAVSPSAEHAGNREANGDVPPIWCGAIGFIASPDLRSLHNERSFTSVWKPITDL
jgi:hypothetical protein